MTKATIRVDNRIRLQLSEIGEAAAKKIREATTHSNPAFYTKQVLGLPTWGEPREIKMWKLEGSELSVPRGCMPVVRAALEEHGVGWGFVDARTEGAICAGVPEHTVTMREYQERMIDAALAKENCIVRAATGSGKTSVAFAIASRLGVNVLVILPTGALFRQWQERAQAELGLKGDKLGEIRGKKRRLRPLTIAMQQTLAAQGVNDELKEFFGAIIIDELQVSAADSAYRIVDSFPARYRIGISASEKRKDKKESLIYGLFGQVAIEVGRDELEAQGHIVGVQVRIIPTKFTADWYGLDVHGDGDKHVDFGRLLDEMINDPERTDLLREHLLREIETGERIIVLSHRVAHCQKLDQELVALGVKSGLLIGGDDHAAEFAKTKAGLIDGSRQVGVGTYLALGYGVDLPAVSVGFATTPIAANKQVFGQVRGRLCRTAKGKTEARIYYLLDELFARKHMENILAWNRDVVIWNGRGWTPARHHRSSGRR